MKTYPEQQQLITIHGILESITFQNIENGFLVGKLLLQQNSNLVIICGNVYNVEIGDSLKLHGIWVEHDIYGLQFQIKHFTNIEPQSLEGIKRYLATDRFKYIGEKTAQQIVNTFGKQTFEIIDTAPEKLLKLSLMNQKKLRSIQKVRAEHRELTDIYVFLHDLYLPSGLIQKIYEKYGLETISIIQNNPYCLAYDIQGIGFKIADHIAGKRKIPKDSLQRAQAALLYFLNQLTQKGHTCYPQLELSQYVFDELCKFDQKILMPHEVIKNAMEDLIKENLLYRIETFVFLRKYYYIERNIMFRLKLLQETIGSIYYNLSETFVTRLEKTAGIILHENQRQAILQSITEKVFVITGGPGTGKTTIIRFILQLLNSTERKILLAAPTGKAAKRVSEATNQEVKTIHRTLEIVGNQIGRNQENPLECDLLIIDECSMIDAQLFNLLLNALPSTAHLIMVGDVDQLPSIGAGAVFRDIIDSQRIPCIRLDKIFRQSEQSLITINAHHIIHGESLEKLDYNLQNELTDFYFINVPKVLEVNSFSENFKTNHHKILDIIVELFLNRIPERFQIPHQDIQILSSIHRGLLGTTNINALIQKKLHYQKDPIVIQDQNFYVDDRVMQLKNDYNLDVFNGDQGFVVGGNNKTLEVLFDQRHILYEISNIQNLTPAWASTIHKFQGSEFPAVIIVITDQHSMMLYRNLLYTAVSRGKKLVVLVGEESAVEKAIQTEENLQRYTFLQQWLLSNDQNSFK